MSVRIAAIRILDQVLSSAVKASVAMAGAQCDEKDRRLLHELVYGVLRRFYSLEADYSRYCKAKPDTLTQAALLLGSYQIRHMRIPTHAAVSETVTAINKLHPKAKGFTNAVLRRVAASELPKRLKPHQRVELPKWLYAGWRDAFGAEAVQEFSKHLQQTPSLCLAVFEDRDAWMKKAQLMGIDSEAGVLSPYAVLLKSGTDVTSLPGYEDGSFTVMDQAAQAAVMALNVKQADGLILDLCAAPGGKTILLSKRFPKASIVAVEMNEKRLPRLLENIERLGCHNVSIIRGDAANLPFTDRSVDGVLLDAPCSASGILRRHPDAKFLHDQDEVKKLASLQHELLQEALRVTKENAALVYAVCSIHPEENEQIVSGFSGLKSERLFPSNSHDGFFFATINKPDALAKGAASQ